MTFRRIEMLMDAYSRRYMADLRNFGTMVARAFNDPDSISEQKSPAELKDQARTLGLETESWM